MRGCFILLLAVPIAYGQAPTAAEIIRRSVTVNEADWQALPRYTHNETDVERRDGARVTKTYEISMIEGSEYQKLIAENGKPLDADEREEQEQRYRREIEKRRNESASDRAKRVQKYQHDRNSDHVLMNELVNAFDFNLVGSEVVGGVDTWVLDATPKPDYKPVVSDAKVLKGMKGRMWIDKAGYHWVRVKAEVIHSVTMRMVARVGPGTRFTFEQKPLPGTRYWVPSHFVQEVNAKVLGFARYGSREEEFYSNYRPGLMTAHR